MAATTSTVSTAATNLYSGSDLCATFDTLTAAFDSLGKTFSGLNFSSEQAGTAMKNVINNVTTNGCCTGGYSNINGTWVSDHTTVISSPLPDPYTIDISSTGPIKTNIVTKDELHDELDKWFKEYTQKKEDKNNMNMKNIFGQFGPVTDGTIALSIKGMAVRNPSGKYVAYDADTEEMYDVDILHFDVKTPIFFKIPVAITAIEFGDIIVHNDSHYCYVIDGDGKQFTVIDITTSEQRVILPQKSPFGFNFVTKVISLMNPGTTADKDNPFGNIMPMMMLAGNLDSKDMLPFLLMGQGGIDFQKNPLLMYFLMKDGGVSNDFLPFLLMNSNSFKF